MEKNKLYLDSTVDEWAAEEYSLLKHGLNALYFDWLCVTVGSGPQSALRALAKTKFYWDNRMDENRYKDALFLRAEWEKANDILACEDREDVSVLEVLVALARRCEVMHCDDTYGDRTWVWFWEWMKNVGLKDNYISEDDAQLKLLDALSHRYDKDGKGGFFYAPKAGKDMRKLDMWYQMTFWYQDTFGMPESFYW